MYLKKVCSYYPTFPYTYAAAPTDAYFDIDMKKYTTIHRYYTNINIYNIYIYTRQHRLTPIFTLLYIKKQL